MRQWIKPILFVGMLVSVSMAVGGIHANADTINPTVQNIGDVEKGYRLSTSMAFLLDCVDTEVRPGKIMYRLAPVGAVDGPAPIELPDSIFPWYLVAPQALSKWTINIYIKEPTIESGIIHAQAKFYDAAGKLQGVVPFMYYTKV
ncbi:hypothetical protein [Bacillus toyonensis]|uniref:hypothetical protein n=1 Tax=Bacillus toyonensis TaxID=155322 RepID=UPI0011AA73FA|nr:hypothetical protein [Bacillus toyonensis]